MDKHHPIRSRRRPNPWTRQMRLLLCGLFVMVMPIAVLGIMKFRNTQALQAHREMLRAQGVPVTFEDLKVRYAVPVATGSGAVEVSAAAPPENLEQRTNVLTRAFASIIPLNNHASADELEKLLFNTPEDYALSSEDREILRTYLADNAEALRLLYEAANCTPGGFPLDYDQGYAMEFPHFSGINSAVRLLQVDVALATEENNPERSCRALKSALSVAATLDEEPFVVSRLVRRGALYITLHALSLTLSKTSLTEEQLFELQRTLEQAHRPEAFAKALETERVSALAAFENPAAALAAGRTWMDEVIPRSYSTALQTANAFGWFSGDRRRMLQRLDELVQATALPYPQARAHYARIEAETARETLLPNLTSIWIPMLCRAPLFLARETARLHQAVVGLALERYRLAHGDVPDQLEALVPNYLKEIPADPFDGQPLRYRCENGGYVIYTIGPGLDYTGKPLKPGDSGSDLAFRIVYRKNPERNEEK